MAFKYIKESVKNFGLTFSKLIVGCSKPSNSPPNKRSCSIQHGMIQDNLQWEHGYREINKVALINLDQSTAVNRLTIIYWRLSCPQTDSKWTHLLYSISGTMVEVKPFMLSKSIHQGCPLSPNAVYSCTWTFPVQAESKMGPSKNQIIWCQNLRQVLCSCQHHLYACNK